MPLVRYRRHTETMHIAPPFSGSNNALFQKTVVQFNIDGDKFLPTLRNEPPDNPRYRSWIGHVLVILTFYPPRVSGLTTRVM